MARDGHSTRQSLSSLCHPRGFKHKGGCLQEEGGSGAPLTKKEPLASEGCSPLSIPPNKQAPQTPRTEGQDPRHSITKLSLTPTAPQGSHSCNPLWHRPPLAPPPPPQYPQLSCQCLLCPGEPRSAQNQETPKQLRCCSTKPFRHHTTPATQEENKKTQSPARPASLGTAGTAGR